MTATGILSSIRYFFTARLVLFRFNLPFSYLDLVLKGVIPLVLLLLLYRMVRALQENGWKHHPLGNDKKQLKRKRVRALFRLLAFVSLALSVVALFNSEIFIYLGHAWKGLSEPFFTSGKTSVSIVTILLLVPILIAANWFGRLTQRFFDANIFHRLHIDEARRFTVSTMSRYVAGGIIAFSGLAIIGIDISAIGVILGVLGIGLGFGLQNIVANFFAGLLIISTRPIKENDRIMVAGIEGTVQQIKLISTNVVTLANESIIIPNAELVSKPVHNLSYQDRMVVVENLLQVAYDTDLDRAIEVLLDCALNVPLVMVEPPPVVRVKAFEDSGIKMAIYSWIANVDDRKMIQSEINLEIWRAFRREGIVIPYPQRDVRLVDSALKPEKEPPPVGSGESGGEMP
jgi:small-conductance mechanosensitive channel